MEVSYRSLNSHWNKVSKCLQWSKTEAILPLGTLRGKIKKIKILIRVWSPLPSRPTWLPGLTRLSWPWRKILENNIRDKKVNLLRVKKVIRDQVQSCKNFFAVIYKLELKSSFPQPITSSPV